MNGRLSVLASLTLALSVPTVVGAQTAVQVHEAELRAPSGNTDGTIVMVADYVLFVDDDRPTGSFSVDRTNVEQVTARDRIVTFHLREPVRTRFGLTEAVSMQVDKSVDLAVLARWPGEAPVATAAAAAGAPAGGEATVSYQTKHDHLPPRGSCEGRLMIASDRLVYESVTNIGHSRRWQWTDVRELKLDNPYELRVEPFSGNSYTFDLTGQGMEPQVFQRLVDRVTAARAGR